MPLNALRRPLRLALLCCLGPLAFAHAANPPTRHALASEDFLRLQAIGNLACSADGKWVAYTLTTTDREADEHRSAVWMVDWAGGPPLRLTAPATSTSSPAFSPDGRYLSFLAEHGPEGKTQLMLIDRRGGEPQALTEVSGDIGEYRWSPDGHHIVMTLAPGDGPAPREGDAHAASAGKAGAERAPRPIVIDRLHFKQDPKGYLTGGDRAQLMVIDVETRTLRPLTRAPQYDHGSPAWSPDGRQIAFLSTRESDPDRSGEVELYVSEAFPGEGQPAVPHRLARFFAANDPSLLWTADGRRLVVSIGAEPRLNAYMQDRLASAAPGGGELTVLAPQLDRALSHAVAGSGSDGVIALVSDDRSEYPATIAFDQAPMAKVERLVPGELTVTDQCSAAGHLAVLASSDGVAPEIHALDADTPGRLRRLTGHNDALMAELALGRVEALSFAGADGDEVHGLMTFPPGPRRERYPTLLWIHGGPNGQDAHGLDFSYVLALERQWLAAQGYLVLAVNYHGSSGRGAAFAESIAGQWGHKEVDDLLAAVDRVVALQLADPQRLGIGGWSYGGILTDYAIARDPRFKAAISGAGSANQLSMYGADQYILQYNHEFGPPWQNTALWIEESYPFFHADRIRTPTLFLGGDRDFNVPVTGGEQMYAALRTLGVPTRLVVYPGQFHGLTRPSFIVDRLERYRDWFDRYLKTGGARQD